MVDQPFRSQWSFDVVNYAAWRAQLAEVQNVLQQSAGFVNLQLLHSPDQVDRYLVQSTWKDVGSYRRATSATAAKLVVWPFLANMIELPSIFETLLEVTADSSVEYVSSVSES
ncbi:MAG: antibiotic biosynthesis monooxygenase [Actinomycetes bacterium]